MKTSHTAISSLQVIIAGICWGSLGIFSTRLGEFGFDSFAISLLRIITAVVLSLVLLPKLWRLFGNLNKKQWLNLILQSLVGMLGMTLSYFYAVEQIGVSMAVALLYTAPVFSLIFAKIILHEIITPKAIVLALVAVVGVACLMLGDGLMLNMGVFVGLLSGLCYSLYGILGKKAMAYHYPPALVFFSSLAISSVVLLCLPTTWATYETLFALPINAWLLVLGLSIIGTIAPYALYMNALNKMPATKAAVFTIIEPLTAIILAIVLLHQAVRPLQIIGIALIIGATLLNSINFQSGKST